jgi:hypothetical protein
VHRLSRARPAFLILTLLMLVLQSGCGRDGGGSGPASDARQDELPSYPGEPSLEPADVARAYVEALDERDGRRFCGLVAPYIAGRYDLAVRDPDGLLGNFDGCPDFVSAFIGYIEDCCPPEFKHARVERIVAVEERGDLRMVRARVRLELVEQDVPRTETLDEVVWVARLGGAWRVAKLEAVARAASLRMARFPDEPQVAGDEDPSAEPDLAMEERAFAALIGDAEQRSREREASYGSLGEAADCSGGASVQDAEGDQIWNAAATKSGDPPRVPGGDLLGVDVVVEGESVCARWRLAGTPEPPLSLSYTHRLGPAVSSFFQPFRVEIREDRTARVTAGEDADGRPIAVPAEVGADGSSVSLRLDAASFRAGQVDWQSPKDPPLKEFGFSAGTVAAAGEAGSVLDDLGSAPSDTFRYLDGRVCDLEGC